MVELSARLAAKPVFDEAACPSAILVVQHPYAGVAIDRDFADGAGQKAALDGRKNSGGVEVVGEHLRLDDIGGDVNLLHRAQYTGVSV